MTYTLMQRVALKHLNLNGLVGSGIDFEEKRNDERKSKYKSKIIRDKYKKYR